MTNEPHPLDGLKVAEPGGGADAQPSVFLDEGVEVVGPGEEFKRLPPPTDTTIITPDEFYETMFKGLFAAPKMLNPAFAPIAIHESEESKARPASDGIYGLLKLYYPAALKPGSETMGYIVMCVPFFALKGMVIAHLIKANRKPPPTRNDTNGEDKE